MSDCNIIDFTNKKLKKEKGIEFLSFQQIKDMNIIFTTMCGKPTPLGVGWIAQQCVYKC